MGQLNAAFIPSNSFKLNYWEYLTLKVNEDVLEEERSFFINGVLIILLCQCVEYNCIATGDQAVFNRKDLPIILQFVNEFKPKDDTESIIKEKLTLGLNIALSMTDEQLMNTDFEHENLPYFYKNLNKIGDDIILSYYESKLI